MGRVPFPLFPQVPFRPDDKASSRQGRNEPSDEVNENLTLHSVFFLPPPTVLCVITLSAAGSHQRRRHRYLKQSESNIFCQEVIFTFSFHSSPNTHPHKDARSDQPCFTLSMSTEGLMCGPADVGRWGNIITIIQGRCLTSVHPPGGCIT